MGKRGDGGIYKRADGRYIAHLITGGRRVYRSAHTRKEAEIKLRELRAERASGTILPKDYQEFGPYLDRWMANIVKGSVKESTFGIYGVYARAVRSIIGAGKLQSLGKDDIRGMIRTITEVDGFSDSFARGCALLVRRCLSQAVEDGILAENPCTGVKFPSKGRSEINPPTIEEIRTLIEGTQDDTFHTLYLVLIFTGIRIGEALALRWDDFDERAGTIRVDQTLYYIDGKGLTFSDTKTASSRRTLRLAPHLKEALLLHRDRQRFGVGGELIFTSIRGEPVYASHVRTAFKKTCDRLQLRRFRLHDLRHAAVALHIASGAGLYEVSRQLGHSSIGTTYDIYGHLVAGTEDETAKRVGDLLEGTSRTKETS